MSRGTWRDNLWSCQSRSRLCALRVQGQRCFLADIAAAQGLEAMGWAMEIDSVVCVSSQLCNVTCLSYFSWCRHDGDRGS
jgi:hypothetical protein